MPSNHFCGQDITLPSPAQRLRNRNDADRSRSERPRSALTVAGDQRKCQRHGGVVGEALLPGRVQVAAAAHLRAVLCSGEHVVDAVAVAAPPEPTVIAVVRTYGPVGVCHPSVTEAAVETVLPVTEDRQMRDMPWFDAFRSPATITGPPNRARNPGSALVTARWNARLFSLRRCCGPREGTYRPSSPMVWPARLTVAAGPRWGSTSMPLGTEVRVDRHAGDGAGSRRAGD